MREIQMCTFESQNLKENLRKYKEDNIKTKDKSMEFESLDYFSLRWLV